MAMFFLVVGFQLPSKRATTDITFTAQMIIYVHLKQKTFWYQVFFSEFRYHFRVAQECSKTKGLVWEWLLPLFYGMELSYAIIFVLHRLLASNYIHMPCLSYWANVGMVKIMVGANLGLQITIL